MLAHRTTALFATALATAVLAGTRAAASRMTPFGEILVFEPVEWKATEGGNGHKYAFVPTFFGHSFTSGDGDSRSTILPGGTRFVRTLEWGEAELFARRLGGHLATVASQEEFDFVLSVRDTVGAELSAAVPFFAAPRRGPEVSQVFADVSNYWIGGYQDLDATTLLPDGSVDPSSGWRWVTDEPFEYTSWNTIEPNDWLGEEESFLQVWASAGEGNGLRRNSWNDNSNYSATEVRAFVVEIPIPEPTTVYLLLACLMGTASRSRR